MIYFCQKDKKKKWGGGGGSPTSFWKEHAPKNALNLKNRASLAYKATALRGKFELTNQDSAGGKKSSVLTSSKKVRKDFEIRQLFSLEMALNIHEKEITFSKTIPVCKK